LQNNTRAQQGESVEEKENFQDDSGSLLEAVKNDFQEAKLEPQAPVVSVVTEEICAVHDELKQVEALSPEEYSDEGWQAATLRGRSANVRKKSIRRRPALTKLAVGRIEDGRTASAQRTDVQPQTKEHKEEATYSPSQLSFGNFFNSDKLNGDPVITEDKSCNATSKSEQSIKPTGINRPTSIASKLVSYKDVAASPPGTVWKPILEQKEAKEKDTEEVTVVTPSSEEEDRNLTDEVGKTSDEGSKEIVSSQPEGGSHSEKASDSDGSTSPNKKTSGSKLSASAPPFNPGSLLSVSHPYSTVAIYDASVVLQTIPSQAMEILPHAVDTRVPRGPRSTLYYRTGHSFQRKQGYTQSQSTIVRGSTSPPAMNPHAAEFVPGKAVQQTDLANGKHVADSADQQLTPRTSDEVKADIHAADKAGQVEKITPGKGKENRGKDAMRDSYKAELARQILLSFIVKSVHDSLGSTRPQPDRKPTAPDEPSNEQSSNITKPASARKEFDKQPKAAEVPKNEKDTEGFTVVSKRRRSKQHFMNPINGLYSQQSICTSVS
jgi:protein TIF31